MTDQGPDQYGDGTGSTPVPTPPQPSAPPPVFNPAPASGVGGPADLGPRFLARLVDHILLGIVTAVIVIPLVVAAAVSGAGTGFGNGFGFSTRVTAGSLISAIVTSAITIGYFSLMESNMGQTVGKMLIGLKTEGPDGNKPTLEQALKRNAWYALSIVPFLGGLAQLALTIYIAVTISNSSTRTGWHDAFAGGTRVIKTK